MSNPAIDIEDQAPREIAWYPKEYLAFRPPPSLKVSEWAEAYRVLAGGYARQPGPWVGSLTPYLKEIMDCYNDPGIRHIVLCFATQLGKTEAMLNILLYIIDLDPYPTLLMYPREDDAKSISRGRLQSSMRACPSVNEKIPDRDDLFQLLEMHFPGMPLYLAGANSAAAVAGKPCRNVLRDEIDKYPDRIGKDASPLYLSDERQKTFWDIRKTIDVSSPTVETRGIWKQLQICDETRRFYIPCYHCGEFQYLKFANVKWESKGEGLQRINRAKQTAQYQCEQCERFFSDEDKPKQLDSGQWRPDVASEYPPETVGFHSWSAYAPWLTYGDIVERFLTSKYKEEEGEIGALQSFKNGWLAEPWIERAEGMQESQVLNRKCSLPALTVPENAIALTAGIDVQKFGFWFTVWAWTRTLESWLIHYGFLADWEDVEGIFDNVYEIEGDKGKMQIWRAGIDTGGGVDEEGWSRTEEIYTWLRQRGRGTVWGVKGIAHSQSAARIRHSVIDRMPGSQKPIPGGLIIWLVDSGAMKDVFFWRLSNGENEPQRIHLHAETEVDFAKQILAEEKRRNAKGQYEWVQIHRNNHLLDASIYAHACADVQWMGGVKVLGTPGQRRPQVEREKKGGWIGKQGPWLGKKGWLKK